MQLLKSSNNLLHELQFKRLSRIRHCSKSKVKFNFLAANSKKLKKSYLDYPAAAQRALKNLFKTGVFFGLGVRGFYSLDFSKKQRMQTTDNYVAKLQVKKDSRFFYGFVLSRWLNFLSSTLTLRNVFYNEIMEKTFPLFSIRNTLVGQIPRKNVKHFLAPYIANIKYKKRFFYLWNYPRADTRITLR